MARLRRSWGRRSRHGLRCVPTACCHRITGCQLARKGAWLVCGDRRDLYRWHAGAGRYRCTMYMHCRIYVGCMQELDIAGAGHHCCYLCLHCRLCIYCMQEMDITGAGQNCYSLYLYRRICIFCMQELEIPRSSLVVSTKIFWGGKGVNDRGLSRKVGSEVLDFWAPSAHFLAIAFAAGL